MPTLILCGLTEAESGEFLEAERVLLEEIAAEARVHTLRLKELPDPADEEKVRTLSRELLDAFGLGTEEFQAEFLSKNGFSFLAIRGGGEKAEAPVSAPGPRAEARRKVSRLLWQVPAVGAGVLFLLVVLYYGIGFLLTSQVNARYADRECARLVDLAVSVETLYPLTLAPFTDATRKQAEECRAYLKAEASREAGDWENSYLAFTAYAKTYPQGIYAAEAREREADSLYEWASEQRGKKDYSGAVDNLTLLLDDYSDTPANSKAEAALPETYLEWGLDCRAGGEFSEAETVYLSLNQWAEQEDQSSLGRQARAELAQTYFDWGKDLQTKDDFAIAAGKFDKAISIDPDAASATGIAAQARAHLPGFQRAWADHLFAQGKYSESIQHYRTSAALSSKEDAEEANAVLVQAYLKWAEILSGKENYREALDRIDEARQAAVTDDTRGDADAARETSLSSFAQSTGAQAKKVIADTTNGICKTGKPIETLPIIGILQPKRLTLSGLTLTLPADVLAKSPGNLYYVACGEEVQTTVQHCTYGFYRYSIDRIRYDWRIKVFHALSGKPFKEYTFRGGQPETCPYRHSFSRLYETHYHYGDKPKSSTVIDWLASLLR